MDEFFDSIKTSCAYIYSSSYVTFVDENISGRVCNGVDFGIPMWGDEEVHGKIESNYTFLKFFCVYLVTLVNFSTFSNISSTSLN